jgi:lysophospholipase L1-like esterase
LQKVIKQSRALLLMLAFLLAFAPMSVLAGSGEKPTVNYVALGDSLAAGTLNTGLGSGGYVGNIVNELETRGYDVNLTNKGKNGFTTNDVFNGLGEVTAELASADLITISVGANDVLTDLIVLIKENPELLAIYKPEYMTPEGIAKLQQVAVAAEGAAKAAEMDAETAKATAQEDITIAKIAIDGVAVTTVQLLVGLRAKLEESYAPPILDIALGKIDELEDAIDDAATSVADEKNIGAEELGNASTALNSSLAIITEVDSFIPIEFKGDVEAFKVQITAAATATDIAKVAVGNANLAVNAAIELRVTADAAQLLFANVMKLVNVFSKIPGKTEAVGANFGKILGAIKSINPNADIYVMGYYNAIPYVDKNVVAPLLYGLNLAIQTPTDGLGAYFVPTAHLFEANNYLVPNSYNIHPNEAGYTAIAGAFLGEIGVSYPKVEPEEPSEKNIGLNEKVNVSAGQKILIKDTDVSLLLPTDLPDGTTLTVTPTSDGVLAKAKGLKDVGDVLNFTFEFPEGFEDYKVKFSLVMGYKADKSFDMDIYYFDKEKDAWVGKKGEVNKESKEISLEASNFGNYGVFAEVEKEDPPVTEKPDDDKTPPVVKNPGKVPPKGNDTTKKPTSTPTPKGSTLPKTATNNFSLLLFGTILLVTGVATLAIRPKKVMS